MKLQQLRENVIMHLIETTLNQLHNSTTSTFPNRADTASVRIKQKQYLKYDSDKLLVKAFCGGETNDYELNILFQGVQFTQPNDPESVTLGDLVIKQLSSDLQIKVSCSCEDFKWTFAWYNSNDGSLMGNPPSPYQSTSERPPRNPSQTSGMCKHLIRLKDDLQAEQVFK